ncbi:uncharacterized protein LOC143144526 [Ptiloglossa arizonensis]|uniref:uncharacterized protein LOC143144526 n=1 Tax=Ptiloglossa arizonensis TaxID=3350558 RepID=UPI003FA0A5CD
MKACNADSNTEVIRIQLEKAEPLYNKFNEIQMEIEMLTYDDQEEIAKEKLEYEEFNETYYRAVSTARRLIAQASRTSAGNASRLPSFNGAFREWLKFRDSFCSLIHENAALTNIQKFHYLQAALIGDAARVIGPLGFSEVNYASVWKKLQERYEDESIHYHVQGLFELPVLTRDSHSEFRQLIDTVSIHLLSLQSLGENIDSWDTMIIYLLESKLNATAKREWERALTHLTSKPTLKGMIKLLEEHSKYLFAMDVNKASSNEIKEIKPTEKYNSASGGRVRLYTATTKNCDLCKEGHALHACEELRRLPVPARVQKVRELGIYFNCLFSGHRNKDCTFGSCRKCSKKHNTLLHLDPTMP